MTYEKVRLLNQMDIDKSERDEEFARDFKEQVARQKEDNEYIELVQSKHLSFEVNPLNQMHAFGFFQQQELNSGFFTIVFVFLYVLMLSPALASDFETKESRFYFFKRIGSLKNITQKILASVSSTYVWLLLLGLIIFLAIGVMNGFGTPNYPAYLINNVFLSAKVDNMSISNGRVILISLLYLPLVLSFLAALGSFISMCVKKSLVVAGVMAVLLVGYSFIRNIDFIQPFRKFIPFNYLNPIELLCHPKYLFGSDSLVIGVVYLLGLSLVFIWMSHILLKRYKIRRL